MDVKLKNKLIDDIHKTGYGSEMLATKYFIESGWNSRPGECYEDYDENKLREIDIEAYQIYRDIKNNVEFEYSICSEVKKAKAPWIVFSHGNKDRDGWSNPALINNMPFQPHELTPILGKYSLTAKYNWIGHGVHEAFKDPNVLSRWYSAAITACKASASSLAFYYDNKNIPHPDMKGDKKILKYYKDDKILIITHPIVIVDSQIFRSWIDVNGKIQIEGINEAPLIINFKTKGHIHSWFRVDLVNIDYLKTYLLLHKKRFNQIKKFLISYINKN